MPGPYRAVFFLLIQPQQVQPSSGLAKLGRLPPMGKAFYNY